MTICGIDLAGIVAATLRGSEMTLRRTWETAEPANPPGAPTTSTTDYLCRGYEQSLQSLRLSRGLVRAGTVAFGIYGDTLDVAPRENDIVVTADGEHKVHLVADRDSDSAVWVLLTYRVTP